MAFRKKKGKVKPCSTGKKKLKRNNSSNSDFTQTDVHGSLTENTAIGACTEEEHAQHDNPETLSTADDVGSVEHGERRRPLRKCRLSVGCLSTATSLSGTLRFNNECNKANVTNLELGINKDKGSIDSSPCLEYQPVRTIEKNEVAVPRAKKKRLCAKVNHNAVKCPQGLIVKDEKVFDEKTHSKLKEQNMPSDLGGNDIFIKKERMDDVPRSANTVIIPSNGSCSKSVYDSLKLRNLRVVVTRTDFTYHTPDKLSGAKKVPSIPEIVRNDNIIGLKQKAKTRVKRASSVKSVSSVEHLDSSSVHVSDVERENKKLPYLPTPEENKHPARRTRRIRSDSSVINVGKSETNEVNNVGIAAASAGKRNSSIRILSKKRNSLSSSSSSSSMYNPVGVSIFNCNKSVCSDTSNEDSELLSNSDECEEVVKKPGNRVKCRITSDDDLDENLDLSANVFGSTSNLNQNNIVREKCSNKKLCSDVSRTCFSPGTTDANCELRYPRRSEDLICDNFDFVELEKSQKRRVNRVLVSNKATQTSFLITNSEVDVKANRNPKKKNVGVQKDMEMACQSIQTKPFSDIVLPEVLREKCEARDVVLFNHANGLPDLMLVLLDQLKSEYSLCINTTDKESKVVEEVTSPIGTSQEVSTLCAYNDKIPSEFERSTHVVHVYKKQRRNDTDQMSPNKEILENNEIHSGPNEVMYNNGLPEVAFESGNKMFIKHTALIDAHSSSKSCNKLSNLSPEVDLLAVRSSDKGSSSKRESKPSKLMQESMQESSKFSDALDQLNPNTSVSKGRVSIKPSRRSTSTSKKKQVIESSRRTKGENYCDENLISSSKGKSLDSSIECGSKEIQNSGITLNKTGGKSPSPTIDVSEKDVLESKETTKKCVENGKNDSEKVSDLSIIWQSKSKKSLRQIKQAKKNAVIGDVAIDKPVNMSGTAKSPLGCTTSDNDSEKGSARSSGPTDVNTLDNVADPNLVVPKIDLLTYRERVKFREHSKSSDEKENSSLVTIPSCNEVIEIDLVEDTQHSSQGSSNPEEVGQSSLNVPVAAVVVKTEDEDSSCCSDDSDIDAISIYGESEYDQLLNGMCSYPVNSLDDSDLESNSLPCHSRRDAIVGENKGITRGLPSKCVVDSNTRVNDTHHLYPRKGNANFAKKTEITLEDVNDTRSVASKEDLGVDHGDTILPSVPVSDLMQTSTSKGSESPSSKNQGIYYDLQNIPRLMPVTQEKYCLIAPMELRALQEEAESTWRSKGSIFGGMCFLFLKKGSCNCQRFRHQYWPSNLQRMEDLSSWNIFINLRFAIRRNFGSFLTAMGVKLLHILANRGEGNFLMGVLFGYCSRKLNNYLWNEILASIYHCGNCDESCVQQILLCLTINYLHQRNVANSSYNELIDKVASMCCTFKETKLICEILEVLDRQEYWFATTTLKNLLQRCLAEASTEVGLELCLIFGKLINRLNGLSNADSLALQLLKELTKVLQPHDENLADSIQGKIMENNSCDSLLKAYSPQNENVTTVSLFGEPKTLDGAELIEKKRANLKRQNSNSIEGSPSKKSLQCNSVNLVSGCKNTDIQTHVINQSKNDDSLPQSEYIVPENSNSAVINNSVSDELQISSKDSHNVGMLTSGGGEDGCNSVDIFPLSTLSSSNSSSSINDRSGKIADFGSHSESNPCVKVLPAMSSVNADVSSELESRNQIAVEVDQVDSEKCMTNSFRELAADDQSSTRSSVLSDDVGIDPLQIDFSSEEELEEEFEEELEVSEDINQSYPAEEIMEPPGECSSQPITYSEVYKKKYNYSLQLQSNSFREVQVFPKDISLQVALKKKQWTPSLLLRFFNSCLTSREHEKNVVLEIIKLVEEDLPAAFSMVKAVVNCLESKLFMETNSTKYHQIKSVISTLVYNLMLKIIVHDMWADAYNILNMADDAGMPLMNSEGFIEEEMSNSRKILLFSEICFHVDKMKEAINILKHGNLFYQAPSHWTYDSYDGDNEIRVTLLNSLMFKLAQGGYSDLAPETYLEIYKSQNGVSESVDLLLHANKVIICALNGRFGNLAYSVYSTLPEDDLVLPKVTLRALLCGMVSEDYKPWARKFYIKMCQYGAYPTLLEKELITEIVIKSFWLKEEILMVFDNALRIWGPILVVDQPAKYKEPDFCISLLVKKYEVPVELDVCLRLEDDSEKDPVPYSLTLQSCSVDRATEDVKDVLEQMLDPAIKYDVVSAEDGAAKRVILNKISLINHLISADLKSESYQ